MDTEGNKRPREAQPQRRPYVGPAFERLDLLETIRSTPFGSQVDALGATQVRSDPSP